MRWFGPLVVALFLGAGCTSPASEPTPHDVGTVTTEDGTVIGADRGLVHGQVQNDQGFPVKGARISILRTEFFADTDENGGFRFVNVTSGSHVIDVSAASFHPYQQEVEVAAGAALELTITLLPQVEAGGGYVPHLHDYWGGDSTYVLMDADVDFAANDEGGDDRPDEVYLVTSGVLRPNLWWPSDRWPLPIPETPHGGPAIVLPGTARMTVTLTWDDATVVLPDLGLCYDSADPDADGCFDPEPAGTAFEIEVTPTMVDSGHQRFSLWNLWAHRSDVRDGTGHSPATTLGTVHVLIELTKGDLFLEPPHRRFWDDGGALVLRSGEPAFYEARCAVACSSKPILRLDEDQIVPPGTDRVEVRLEWEYSGPGAAPIDHDWEVIFRTGDMNPQQTHYLQYREYEATQGSASERFKVYEIDVDPTMTDAFYQLKSIWRFGLWNASFERDAPEVNPRDIEFHLEVVAVNVDA